MEGLGMGGPDMGGLIWYGACNGGPGIVRNVPNPAPLTGASARYSSFARHTMIPATGEERCVTKQNDCVRMNEK